jgi:hypothetical protein
MSEDPNTDRTSVRTYVPAYQKEEWSEHADELGMSQSEFVRTMVQAGRRGFDLEGGDDRTVEEPADQHPDPGGGDLEDRIQTILEREGVISWNDLLEEVTGEIETQLEETLDRLQDEGAVRYRGREGGYVLIDE